MLLVVCKRCGHKWDYTGYKINFLEKGIHPYVICPVCHANCRLEEKNDDSEKVGK